MASIFCEAHTLAMATLDTPLPPLSGAGGERVCVVRTSAWRQTTYPDTDAGESLAAARSQRLHIVHVRRGDAPWTFAPSQLNGSGKRARTDVLSSDGVATVAKTARCIATYAIETHVGEHPPNIITRSTLAYALSQRPEVVAAAVLVYAVSASGVSRLGAAADAGLLVVGAFSSDSVRNWTRVPATAANIGLDAAFGDAWPVDVGAAVVSLREHTRSRFAAAERENEAAYAREIARAPGLVAERDRTLADGGAADGALKSAEHALDVARALYDKAKLAFASARVALDTSERVTRAARACAETARERAARLAAGARVEPLDAALLEYGSHQAVLMHLSFALGGERYHNEDGAASDRALAEHALSRSDGPPTSPWREDDPLGAAASRVAPRTWPLAVRQWYEEAFALPNTASAYVCARVCERVLARWVARGHTVADIGTARKCA